MAAPTHPAAERLPLVEHLHGHPVADPYRWLEDPGSTATTGWLAEQDSRWQAAAALLPGRDRWRESVATLSAPGLVRPPVWRGDRQFFLRQNEGQEHPVLMLSTVDGERPVLDPMTVDPDGLAVLDAWRPSPDGRLLAVQLSRGGTENSALQVLDVDSGATVDGPIGGCRYAPLAWLPDGTGFYYVRATEAGRQVYRHRLGTPVHEDLVVPGPPTTASLGIDLSADGRWLVLAASRPGASGTDVWLRDTGTGATTPVHTGLAANTAATVAADGRLYLITDHGAPRRRVCVADPLAPQPEHWRELIAEDPDAVIGDFAVLDTPEPALVLTRVRHTISEVALHDPATGALLAEVPLPGAGSVGSLAVRPGQDRLWFSYTDGGTPGSVHCYQRGTHRSTPWAQPADAPAAVRSTVLVARSADGTPVRATVLDTPGAGTGARPTILYGYGGFGLPLVPSYSSFALAWVRAGGVFVTAQVRGGGEEGEQWHRDGMLDRKQNTVDDFVAVAELLVGQGRTTPAQLGICGESNGGLLVGAALTQRPELFAAAVCSAPVLDMVRYERFGLGGSWRGEYGSATDPEQLGWLLGYSPYHRVQAGTPYPATLLTTFGGDTRVDPAHARKMCAALQWASTATAERPVLLRHEDGVGHAASAASRATALAGDLLAFLAAHTGLDGGLDGGSR